MSGQARISTPVSGDPHRQSAGDRAHTSASAGAGVPPDRNDTTRMCALMTKTQAGDYYRDVKVGDGPEIAGIPSIVISYQAYLKDGTLVAVVNSGTVVLGSMIPGLRDAMQGMRPGGERLIVVPSAMAYGNATTVTGIPPNSTLVFDLLFKAYPLQ